MGTDLDAGDLWRNFLLSMKAHGSLILGLCFVQAGFDRNMTQPGAIKMLTERGVAEHGLDI